jgi:YegS/Rv2252/BmrU family lipid kinase
MEHPEETNWLIIVNPNAGSKKGERQWPAIRKTLIREALPFEQVLTEGRNHAIQIAREQIASGRRKIAVVGGDGTMNEVLNGIMTQEAVSPAEITLGMIPVGTGNDWCRMFDIPFDFRKAIGILKRGKTFMQDVGKITYHAGDGAHTRYYMNIAGMGYDALVAKKTNMLKEQGRGNPLAYIYFVFAGLFQYKFMEGVIEIDDKVVFKGEIFSMNAGICKYNGGGMKQVPNAIPDDGLTDVTLIRKTSKFMVIRYARKLFDGTLIDLPIVNTYRGKLIRMRSPEKIYLEADGESLGHTPLTFDTIPRILKVVVGN